MKTDNKLNGKRSLSEGSVKVKHRKSNIRRTLTHPFTYMDDFRDVSMIGVFNSDVKVEPPPESDESNLPPTSSDRDTEDDGRLSRPAPQRSRWDSGSEMDSLVSTVVRRARRRRTPANPGEVLHIIFINSIIFLIMSKLQGVIGPTRSYGKTRKTTCRSDVSVSDTSYSGIE